MVTDSKRPKHKRTGWLPYGPQYPTQIVFVVYMLLYIILSASSSLTEAQALLGLLGLVLLGALALFRFENVPPGEYYLVTSIFGQPFKAVGRGPQWLFVAWKIQYERGYFWQDKPLYMDSTKKIQAVLNVDEVRITPDGKLIYYFQPDLASKDAIKKLQNLEEEEKLREAFEERVALLVRESLQKTLSSRSGDSNLRSMETLKRFSYDLIRRDRASTENTYPNVGSRLVPANDPPGLFSLADEFV